MIILLTDGQENTAPYVSEVLPDLLQTNIKVFTIGLGYDIDEDLLRDVASRSSGQYYPSPIDQELRDIYAAVSARVAGRQSLFTESGRVAQADPDIEYVRGNTYAYYRVRAPEVGRWTLRIEGQSVRTSDKMRLGRLFAKGGGQKILKDLPPSFSARLANLAEFQQGTDPLSADTDEDFLADGEEVNVHSTTDVHPSTSGEMLGILRLDGYF